MGPATGEAARRTAFGTQQIHRVADAGGDGDNVEQETLQESNPWIFGFIATRIFPLVVFVGLAWAANLQLHKTRNNRYGSEFVPMDIVSSGTICGDAGGDFFQKAVSIFASYRTWQHKYVKCPNT